MFLFSLFLINSILIISIFSIVLNIICFMGILEYIMIFIFFVISITLLIYFKYIIYICLIINWIYISSFILLFIISLMIENYNQYKLTINYQYIYLFFIIIFLIFFSFPSNPSNFFTSSAFSFVGWKVNNLYLFTLLIINISSFFYNTNVGLNIFILLGNLIFCSMISLIIISS